MAEAFHTISSQSVSVIPDVVSNADAYSYGALVRIVSTKSFHYAIGTVATTSDTLVDANDPILINPPKDTLVSVLLASGETSGDVFLSSIRLYSQKGAVTINPTPDVKWHPFMLGSKLRHIWDLSDLTKMYKDAFAVDPVNAHLDSVYTILDKAVIRDMSPDEFIAKQSNILENPNFSEGTYDAGGGILIPNGWNPYALSNMSVGAVVDGNYVFTATANLAGIQQGIPLNTINKRNMRARRVSGSTSTSLQTYHGTWTDIVPRESTIGEWFEIDQRLILSHPSLIISSAFSGVTEWEIDYAYERPLIGAHMSQSTAEYRGLLGIVNGIYGINTDGTNDGYAIGFLNENANVSDLDFYWAGTTSDDDSVLFSSGGFEGTSAPYAGRFDSGDISADINSPAATRGTFVDGVAVSPHTRQQLHTEASDGTPHVITIKGLDMTNDILSFSGWGAASDSLRFSGLTNQIVITEELTAAEDTLLITWLSEKAGKE